jgi:hypothetical protein
MRNRGSVSTLSENTTTLYVMVDTVKDSWCATPTLISLGWFYTHDEMYAKMWPLPLCVYSVIVQQDRYLVNMFFLVVIAQAKYQVQKILWLCWIAWRKTSAEKSSFFGRVWCTLVCWIGREMATVPFDFLFVKLLSCSTLKYYQLGLESLCNVHITHINDGGLRVNKYLFTGF